MDTKPARAKRRYLIIPLAIGGLLLAGYTALWLYGAGIMRDEIAKFIASEERGGRTITYESMKIRGYPMALRAQIEGFTWADPGEWDWSGETLHIIAMPHDIETLVFAPRGPQALLSGGEYYTITPNNLRVGIAEDKYSAEGTGMLIESASERSLKVGSLKANWNTDKPGNWILGAAAREIIYTDEAAREAHLPGVNIVLSHEPGQGEEVTIDASEIAFDDGTDGPPTLITVDGTLGVDTQDYPAGRLEVTYRDEQKLLSLIRSFEIASPEDILQAELVLKAYRSGKSEATVPFSMKDGELYISGIARAKVGDLPKIR